MKSLSATGFGPFSENKAEGAEDQSDETCPQCGGRLIPQEASEKPGWQQLMNSSARPSWYKPQRSLPAASMCSKGALLVINASPLGPHLRDSGCIARCEFEPSLRRSLPSIQDGFRGKCAANLRISDGFATSCQSTARSATNPAWQSSPPFRISAAGPAKANRRGFSRSSRLVSSSAPIRLGCRRTVEDRRPIRIDGHERVAGFMTSVDLRHSHWRAVGRLFNGSRLSTTAFRRANAFFESESPIGPTGISSCGL